MENREEIVDFRLNKVEKDVESLKEQNTTLQLAFGRFESKQDSMLESINNLKEAVKALTDKNNEDLKRPVKELNAIKVSLITSVSTLILSSGITFLISRLIK